MNEGNDLPVVLREGRRSRRATEQDSEDAKHGMQGSNSNCMATRTIDLPVFGPGLTPAWVDLQKLRKRVGLACR